MHSAEIDALPDEELELLNELLPWATFIEDSHGRRFGKPFSETKRIYSQKIPDRRIVLLNQKYDLSDKKVLELGCLEGIHTVALAQFAKFVVGVDARIENVVKSLVRLWAYQMKHKADVFFWDVEKEPQDPNRIRCDILHHVGVLYHLTDPVKHLNFLLPLVGSAAMLDTHVATPENTTGEFHSMGKTFPYRKFGESGREIPFSGLYDHAKWLLEEDLIEIFKANDFQKVEIVERRHERNGLRVLFFAER